MKASELVSRIEALEASTTTLTEIVALHDKAFTRQDQLNELFRSAMGRLDKQPTAKPTTTKPVVVEQPKSPKLKGAKTYRSVTHGLRRPGVLFTWVGNRYHGEVTEGHADFQTLLAFVPKPGDRHSFAKVTKQPKAVVAPKVVAPKPEPKAATVVAGRITYAKKGRTIAANRPAAAPTVSF